MDAICVSLPAMSMTRRCRAAHPGLAAVATALVLAGCVGPTNGTGASDGATSPPGPGTQVGLADPDQIDPARLEPLAGLPDCPSPPAAAADTEADVEGLPLPADAVVTAASTDGALRNVQGFTPRTPVEVMVDYLRLDGWTVVAAEDEVFESEILLEQGGLRVFVKSQAICERGAAFVLFASTDDALVPAPAGHS